MQPRATPVRYATVPEVIKAIDALTGADALRLLKVARCVMGGSEYQRAEHLVQAAVTTPLFAAAGHLGRQWPVEVPFMAFLIMTMKGLAHDSRGRRERTRYVSTVVRSTAHDVDGTERTASNVLDFHHLATQSFEQTLLEEQECTERRCAARTVLAQVLKRFKRDRQVMAIIGGLGAGKRAHEIWEQAGMSQTEYENARKRLRRGLEKLFPKRNPS